MLTENQIKELIKYTGNKYHKIVEEHDFGLDGYALCACGQLDCCEHNPTFTTPDDKDVLLRAIIEKGEWEDFYGYFIDNEYMNLNNSNLSARKLDIMVYMILLSPLETAELVCKWKGWK